MYEVVEILEIADTARLTIPEVCPICPDYLSHSSLTLS